LLGHGVGAIRKLAGFHHHARFGRDDERAARDQRRLLNRLRADYGLTFLVISHDLDMVRIVADRVMVMDKGRIIETGTPAQLLDKPQEPLTKELIAASLPDVGIVPVL